MRLPALLLIAVLAGCQETSAPEAPAFAIAPSGNTVTRDGWHVVLRQGTVQRFECWLPAGNLLPTADTALKVCQHQSIEVPPPIEPY